MKKILNLLLSLFILISLASCANNKVNYDEVEELENAGNCYLVQVGKSSGSYYIKVSQKENDEKIYTYTNNDDVYKLYKASTLKKNTRISISFLDGEVISFKDFESKDFSYDTYKTTIYADYSYGKEYDLDSLMIKAYEVSFEKANTSDYISFEEVADLLSELTGLNFAVSSKLTDEKDGVIIDWKKESSLFENYTDIKQKDEFFLKDYEHLVWFMLDSLYTSIINQEYENKIEHVYYTYEGESLDIEAYLVTSFNELEEYKGSPFYFAKAEEEGNILK